LEGRGWKEEVGKKRLEGGRKRLEGRGWKVEVGREKLEGRR